MKRKSLLVAMASVSLAAIGAGTVSTLAWFSVDASSKSVVNDSKNVGVIQNTYSMGAITFNIQIGIANDAKVKLSDKDGYSHVLINNAKVKDTTVALNDSSMYTSGALTVTATVPVENSDPRTPTTDEYSSIAGTYKVAITGANHTKVALTSGADAIAVDLYEKYTDQDVLPTGKQIGDDKESLIAGNTVEVQFTVSSSGITLSSTTVYAAVQGAAGVETSGTFTTNKPTVSTKLYVQGAGDTWTEIN